MTPETILRTKLFAPPPRRNLVARPRLLKQLANALCPETRLTLICAPAGFGKTTAVAEWIYPLSSQAGKEPTVGWLTLDTADNDPIRFWRYIDAALQNIDPRLGESIRPALYAPQPPPFRSFLAELINDILSAGTAFVLVLDDYHHIENETIHESLSFLIDHLPPVAHLVLTTRSDPPLQLARRRARGELCELRAADLRFTHEEAAQFINEIMRLGLSAEDVAALEARTEGWIAGLQMAAISLQDVADPHAFVAAFRGDDRYIADYLLEEVLQRQPVEFQQFLLQTSVLTRLNSSLCNAITGRSDSQTVLNTLERANLFVIPLDNRREWFRYHHLFASLLQQRLADTAGPEAVLDLKRRASRWHTTQGDVVDAGEIALSCGDYEQAVTIIEAANIPLFMGAELNTLRQWTERIPRQIIANHPRLNMMAAWASHATGYPQQAERFVELIEVAAGVKVEDFLGDTALGHALSPVKRSALLEGAVVLARVAVDRLDLEKAFAIGERALPRLVTSAGEAFAFNPPDHLRCVILFILGLAHQFRGDLAQAARLFAEAEAEAITHQNQHIMALSSGHAGEVQTLHGQLDLARATYQRALDMARVFPPHSSPFWGISLIGLGELAMSADNLESAEDHFQAGIELGKIWNTWECLLPGMVGLARIRGRRGEWQAAFATLEDLLERTTANTIMVKPAVDAQRAAFQLQQGDLPAAAGWAAAFDADHPAAYRLQWEQSALIAAQIWLAEGKTSAADALLTRLLAEAEAAGHEHRVQQIHALRQRGFPSDSPQSKVSHLIEALSERELEVLRLMAEGLSNPAIAQRLYLTPNTLKAHAHHIFGKLGVHGRMEAVNKARALGIL